MWKIIYKNTKYTIRFHWDEWHNEPTRSSKWIGNWLSHSCVLCERVRQSRWEVGGRGGRGGRWTILVNLIHFLIVIYEAKYIKWIKVSSIWIHANHCNLKNFARKYYWKCSPKAFFYSHLFIQIEASS